MTNYDLTTEQGRWEYVEKVTGGVTLPLHPDYYAVCMDLLRKNHLDISAFAWKNYLKLGKGVVAVSKVADGNTRCYYLPLTHFGKLFGYKPEGKILAAKCQKYVPKVQVVLCVDLGAQDTYFILTMPVSPSLTAQRRPGIN